MKKLLTAIAGLSVLAAGILAATPAQAQFYTFGENADDDLNDLWLNGGNAIINQEQFKMTNAVAGQLNITWDTLLQEPEQLNALYDANDPSTHSILTFSHGGCSVDVGCALPKMGLATALKCVAKVGMDVTDAKPWAECLQEVDSKAYDRVADAGCVENCPGFATLPGQKVFACNNSVNSVLAGNTYLNLPSTLEPQKKELQISWLSQG